MKATSKHRNGTMCVFPGCQKKMRTQKFKGHYIRTHLREGETYTVDCRRQFEVALSEDVSDSDGTPPPSTDADPDPDPENDHDKENDRGPDGDPAPDPESSEQLRMAKAESASAAASAMPVVQPLSLSRRAEAKLPALSAAVPTTEVSISMGLPPSKLGTQLHDGSKKRKRGTSAAAPVSVPGPSERAASTAISRDVLEMMDRRFREVETRQQQVESKLDAMLAMQRQILARLGEP